MVIGNDTIDVYNKGCFGHLDSIGCFSSVTLVVMAAVTLFFVIWKIIKYHLSGHKQFPHYGIFYSSVCEILIIVISVMIPYRLYQLDYILNAFKLTQFSLLCYLTWNAVATTFNSSNCCLSKLIIPSVWILTFYTIFVAVMGLSNPSPVWTICMSYYWRMFSIADLCVVQVFACVGIYSTHKINSTAALASFKRAQRVQLQAVVAAYEISAIVSLSYDITMEFLGTEDKGCSGIFLYNQKLYSFVQALYISCKYLLPIIVLLNVFQPPEENENSSEEAINASYHPDGTPTSSIRGNHLYQRMLIPSTATANPAILSPDNLLSFHSNCYQDQTPSPTWSEASSNCIDLPRLLSSSDAMSYTNKVNLNYNEDINVIARNSDSVPFVSCSNKLSVTTYNRPRGLDFMINNLTTISEESNINFPPSGDPSEHNSVKSDGDHC